MVTTSHILDAKRQGVVTIDPDASVLEGLRIMAEHHIGAVMVLSEQRLVGVLTERDYSRKVVLRGKSSKDTAVRDVMTTQVLYAEPDDTLDNCMALMTQHRVRYLPVLVEGRVVGVVSMGDLVRARIDELTHDVELLERYIHGSYPG